MQNEECPLISKEHHAVKGFTEEWNKADKDIQGWPTVRQPTRRCRQKKNEEKIEGGQVSLHLRNCIRGILDVFVLKTKLFFSYAKRFRS